MRPVVLALLISFAPMPAGAQAPLELSPAAPALTEAQKRKWTCFDFVESGLLGGPLELGGADEVQRRVAPDRIVEAIDVTGQGLARLGPCLERRAPDELAFQRLEERLDHRVIIAVPLA